MRRYPSTHIPPFPSDLDRGYFGAWFSGFADGESCFNLSVENKVSPKCYFTISLRQDDCSVLHLIQSFLVCGRVRYRKPRYPNQSPVATYDVTSCRDCIRCLVPHFDAFHLLAKKKHDYIVWKEGVLLCYKVATRPVRNSGRYHGGWSRHWTTSEFTRFVELKDTLTKQRGYNSSGFVLPSPRQQKSDPTLFDDTI